MYFLLQVWRESELILYQEDLALGEKKLFLTTRDSRLPENVVSLSWVWKTLGAGLLGRPGAGPIYCRLLRQVKRVRSEVQGISKFG